MTKKRIRNRVILVVIAALLLSMLASYVITYAARHEADPLRGVWMNTDAGFEYGLSFKNGKFDTIVNGDKYSRMNYKILSSTFEGDTNIVTVLQYDDTNSYNAVYEITGNTMTQGGIKYTKQ